MSTCTPRILQQAGKKPELADPKVAKADSLRAALLTFLVRSILRCVNPDDGSRASVWFQIQFTLFPHGSNAAQLTCDELNLKIKSH
jgi:hypothetical protein